MTDGDNWTQLPPKWTPSSILKLHDRLLSKFLTHMLYNDNELFSKEEKNRRINQFVEWTQLIHDYAMSGQMSYKKD